MFDGIGTAVVGVVAAILGWLAKRWFTNEPETEEAANLLQIVELELKLREAGLTLEQVQETRENIKRGNFKVTDEVLEALTEAPEKPLEGDQNVTRMEEETSRYEADAPDFRSALMDMRIGLGQRLHSLEADLERTLEELQEVTSDTRAAAIREAHEAWKNYASMDAEAAGLHYEGGSLEPVIKLSVRIDLTERRLEDLETDLHKERSESG